jgi:thymidylate synthase
MKATKKDLHESGRVLSQEEFINKIKTNDEFANKFGELGPIYGKQWRSWGGKNTTLVDIGSVSKKNIDKVIEAAKNKEDVSRYGAHIKQQNNSIDQIANLINDLKTNPDSRRLMVNAWNVGELDQMVLPPCHYGFQVYTRELSLEERFDYGLNVLGYEGLLDYGHSQNDDDKILEFLNYGEVPKRAISLMFNMRSVDTFLGLPFNIASYGLLLEIIAKEVNMVPEELIGNLGDVHLYSNHIEQAKEQIGRKLTLEERFELWDNKENEYAMDTYNKLTSDSSKHIFLSDRHQGSVKERTREPFPLPTLKKLPDYLCIEENWECYEIDDIQVENYQSHPTIKAPLSN